MRTKTRLPQLFDGLVELKVLPPFPSAHAPDAA